MIYKPDEELLNAINTASESQQFIVQLDDPLTTYKPQTEEPESILENPNVNVDVDVTSENVVHQTTSADHTIPSQTENEVTQQVIETQGPE